MDAHNVLLGPASATKGSANVEMLGKSDANMREVQYHMFSAFRLGVVPGCVMGNSLSPIEAEDGRCRVTR
jgi:hypothetical protein